jgi:cytochrome c biogenesis protein
MSSLEETGINSTVDFPVPKEKKESLLSMFLGMLCSVRFGIIILILLGLACFIGMVIMQQNVDGFESYFSALTPSQRLVYGSLGLFDIYHSWYFNALLIILSMNIILASIDRFPKTWTFISKPKLFASAKWLKGQKASHSVSLEGEKDEVIQTINSAFQTAGWKKNRVNEKKGTTTVFSETGRWNRLGAYAVHIGLLTIFLGGFLTAQLGHTGQMPLSPGQSSNQVNEIAFELDQMKQVNKTLPFEVYCTDIQQKLIKKDGSISASNTIDWLTTIQIKDETGTHDAVVHMNAPYDYRGYRFFQSSFVSVGRARNISLRVKDESGKTQDIAIKRNGSVNLADGTNVKFADFRGKFNVGTENPNEDTSSYPNPAAVLQVTPEGETSQTAYAFDGTMSDIPIAGKPVGGYTFQLLDFEKVADQHILSVQRDPGATVVYIGFTLLFLTLVAVFFFSHQRIWAVIEETSKNNFAVTIGGNTNRNQTAFEEKFTQIIKALDKSNKEAI